MKTSDEGKSPSDKGSVSGQKACGAAGNAYSSRIRTSEEVRILGALPEEPESLPTNGVMTSPNFPADYPNDLHQRKTIQVAEGNVLNIHFTDFDVEHRVDYVQLSDADGTNLGHFASKDDIKGNITSRTETVFVLFHTDSSVTKRGWSLEWSKYYHWYYKDEW